MRKLMWFAAGFTAACLAGIYLLTAVWFLLIGMFCLLGAVAVWFLKGKTAKATAFVLLGCVVGFGWLWGYDSLYLSDARACDNQIQLLTITASDYGYQSQYGESFDGTVQLEEKSYQVRCYLNTQHDIQPADIIRGEFRLRYTADGGVQPATYHSGKGIFLLAYEEETVTVSKGIHLRILDYIASWRKDILEMIECVFPEDAAGFAKALLLGETGDLTYTQDRAFQVSGIRHVIAVSGLHISVLFALVYLLLGNRRYLTAIVGVPVLFLFAAMAGFSASVVRACTMQCLMILALMVNKEYDPATALAFAMLVILSMNPIAVTDVGFQLSFGCMAGIFLFSEKLQAFFLKIGNLEGKSKGKGFAARSIRWMTGSVSVTISAMAVTTPLCAIYFGMISLVGVLTNLLTLWVVSFIFYGILLSCLMGWIWLPLGTGFAAAVAWLIRYVFWISAFLAKFPLAAIFTDSVYIVFWLIFTYLLLTVFFVLKRKHPWITVLGILTMLCVCLGLSWLEPRMDDVRVAVIDVGQGQSVLLQSGEEFYLVDCGSEDKELAADRTANFLLSQGIFRLDGIILTHYDTDHAGDVLNLLSSVKADRIYMPEICDSNGIRACVEVVYGERICCVKDMTTILFPDGTITLYPAQTALTDNESSMCVLFQSGNCDILITGDRSKSGERKLLQQAQLPHLELLVVGHHGSANATSHELLQATKPKMAVISVGGKNHYGHPRKEVLERLSLYGCSIQRTDLQGTIIFRG